MIWYNIKKLEKKIIEKDFSDDEGFKYFLAFSILGVLVGYVSTTENFITYIECLIGIVITIWGSYSIFKTNSSGDGQDFFKRYFALSWVIGFRLLVISLLVAIPLLVLYGAISPDYSFENTEETTLMEDFVYLIIGSLISLIYYFMLTNSFKRVAKKTKK